MVQSVRTTERQFDFLTRFFSSHTLRGNVYEVADSRQQNNLFKYYKTSLVVLEEITGNCAELMRKMLRTLG